MTTALDKIYFHYLDTGFYFPDRNKLKAFLLNQLKAEGRSVETINYIFCNDAFLLAINQQYLNHDTLTDIVTFELSPKSGPILSDIYISVDRVKENAGLFSSSFTKELHRVIFHGALHLVGYKDKSNKDKKMMRAKEEEWLRKYYVSRKTVLQ